MGRLESRSSAGLRERRVMEAVELVLLLALCIALGVAAFKFFRMLERIGVPWTRGIPVGVMFAGAAYFACRRFVKRLRRFSSGEGDGTNR